MSTKLHTLIINSCTAHDGLQALVNDIAKQAKSMTLANYRKVVVEALTTKYGIEPHESRTTKQLTFVKDSAPEQKLGRLMKLHPQHGASTKSHRKEVKVSPVLVASIVDEVVEAGLTKAEFDVLIAKLRESIQFA